MTNILCIIPARGGSKRIPRKNVLPLGGKPLISYSIEAALTSGVFADVVVSSDAAEVLDVARSMGSSVDERPTELCGDKTRAVEVVEEYLVREEIKGRYEYVAMLLPTCPFRTALDISRATGEFLKDPRYDYLVGVSEYDFPPQLSMSVAADNKTLTMNDQDSYRTSTRSQEQKNYYHPNGAIYMARTGRFLAARTFFADPMMAYVMPAERSFDIDYPYQFRIAEHMIKELAGDG